MSPPQVPSGPTRFGPEDGPLALVLPGGAYTPARPLLHFAGAVLRRRGWAVREVWWDEHPTWSDLEPAPTFVHAQLARALAEERARERRPRLMVVGKSLGTFAAADPAVRDLPAIWLTPVLTDPRVVEGLRRAEAPALLVGGTADRVWDGDVARRTGGKVLEIPAADHSLETDDPVRSAEILRQVVEAMDEFVATL